MKISENRMSGIRTSTVYLKWSRLAFIFVTNFVPPKKSQKSVWNRDVRDVTNLRFPFFCIPLLNNCTYSINTCLKCAFVYIFPALRLLSLLPLDVWWQHQLLLPVLLLSLLDFNNSSSSSSSSSNESSLLTQQHSDLHCQLLGLVSQRVCLK